MILVIAVDLSSSMSHNFTSGQTDDDDDDDEDDDDEDAMDEDEDGKDIWFRPSDRKARAKILKRIETRSPKTTDFLTNGEIHRKGVKKSADSSFILQPIPSLIALASFPAFSFTYKGCRRQAMRFHASMR